MERNLVHGEGDYLGRPFQVRPFQRDFTRQAYELHPDGSRAYRRVLLGMGKGGGKTELAAALAIAEAAGPVVCTGFRPDGTPLGGLRISPDIPVAAGSFDQANLLFSTARTMIAEGPLAPYFDIFDKQILLKNRPGRLYRVYSVAGTNDGRRPTFFVADELHEWACACDNPEESHNNSCGERVHLVLSNGRAKRADAWELNISTAGWNMRSLLGQMYREGKALRGGRRGGFLFVWYEPDGEVELADRRAVRRAIKQANPAAGAFLPIDGILDRLGEMPPHEFRRYYLNQWVEAPNAWMTDAAWEAISVHRQAPPDGSDVVLAFDGSYSRDATGIVGATLDDVPHLWVVGAWELAPNANFREQDWRVDIAEVLETIRQGLSHRGRPAPLDGATGTLGTGRLPGASLADAQCAEDGGRLDGVQRRRARAADHPQW
jgi:phage terminase large subunit-like protein